MNTAATIQSQIEALFEDDRLYIELFTARCNDTGEQALRK